MTKILVLSPHSDDAEIGCGASIAKHIEQGNTVKVIALTQDTTLEFPAQVMEVEFYNSMSKLGLEDFELLNYKVRNLEQNLSKITNVIHEKVSEFKPNILYIPFPNSRHEDHVAVSLAGLRVTGRKNISVLGYYILGDGNNFCPTYFEPVEEKHIDLKIEALNCYKSQYIIRPFFNDTNFRMSLRYYASMTEHKNVESFEVLKWVNEK